MSSNRILPDLEHAAVTELLLRIPEARIISFPWFTGVGVHAIFWALPVVNISVNDYTDACADFMACLRAQPEVFADAAQEALSIPVSPRKYLGDWPAITDKVQRAALWYAEVVATLRSSGIQVRYEKALAGEVLKRVPALMQLPLLSDIVQRIVWTQIFSRTWDKTMWSCDVNGVLQLLIPETTEQLETAVDVLSQWEGESALILCIPAEFSRRAGQHLCSLGWQARELRTTGIVVYSCPRTQAQYQLRLGV